VGLAAVVNLVLEEMQKRAVGAFALDMVGAGNVDDGGEAVGRESIAEGDEVGIGLALRFR